MLLRMVQIPNEIVTFRNSDFQSRKAFFQCLQTSLSLTDSHHQKNGVVKNSASGVLPSIET